MHINKLTTSPPSVLSTALFKMSSSDSDSHSNASQGGDSHARLLESIARCPQAIKDLSDALMPALINNLEHIAERNQAWLRSEEPRAHREGRSASTSGEQVSLNASDGGDPGGDVGGSAISSLNGPGSGSGADGRSGSGMEASLTSSGYEAGDSTTGNEARSSISGNEATNSRSGNEARSSISGNEARNSIRGNEATGGSGSQAMDSTLPMYFLPPSHGFPVWLPSNQARHHQGAQAQNFSPYGLPVFFPYPGLWQSSQCISYPCPPQGGGSSGWPEGGPSTSGSNLPQTSGTSFQQGSGSRKRPRPPAPPSPSGSSETELNPHVSEGERIELLGGEYSESENEMEEDTDLSEPVLKKRFTPGEETLRFLSSASSKPLKNDRRRKVMDKLPMPACDAAHPPKLNESIAWLIPKSAKSFDKYLSRLQRFTMDAMGPLTWLCDKMHQGSVAEESIRNAIHSSISLLGNASAHFNVERRKAIMKHLNADIKHLAEAEFPDRGPYLFGEVFGRAKAAAEDVRALKGIQSKKSNHFSGSGGSNRSMP